MDSTTAFVVGTCCGALFATAACVICLCMTGKVSTYTPPNPPPPAPKRNGSTYVEPGSMKRSTARAENPSYLNRQN